MNPETFQDIAINGKTTDQQMFKILSLSSIPFAIGQSSLYGCDCCGLIELYYKLCGEKIDLSGIPRKVMKVGSFIKHAEAVGFVHDQENGVLAIFQDQNAGHCGLTDGKVIIHQSNVSNSTLVTPYYPEVLRYTYKGVA